MAERPAAEGPDPLDFEILAELEAEVDEGEEILAADDDGDDGDEEATSVDDLGLPMPVLAVDEALALLHDGALELVGRLWASTNNAMLCVVRGSGLEAACIYKPVMGERPLRDFPDYTLARREVAAFVTGQASGWNLVPPTVLREGPFGEGMVQLWIAADPSVDPVALVVEEDPRLRRMAVFDAVVNNTDRKAGHLVPVPGGHVYGVDHGVTFSPVPKLRTVLWAWRGEPFAEDELAVLRGLRLSLDDALGEALRELLDPIEVRATAQRVEGLLDAGIFPQPDPRRPALPWPPV
ncbi:MAG TPA: SCO1664 family protein [Candidatus Limnocylindrales bacterium]|nr:SCO1664 family protein [Candidatus Limnocylindrales bacterium]